MTHDARATVAAGRDNRVIDARDGTERSWADLADPEVDGSLAVVADTSIDALPYVWAHLRSGYELLVVAGSRFDPEQTAELSRAGFIIARHGGMVRPSSARAQNPGRIWVLTSGSTGRPKRVGHTFASLSTAGRAPTRRRWLCPYSPGTYAWWQLVTLALSQPGQDLVVVDPSRLDRWVESAVAHDVTAVSGTPTFWRQALARDRDRLARLPLAQVTLGGEPVDQPVLDQLAAVFPHARISWVYASSEVGASVVVHDGRAGFPVEWLDRESPGRPVLSLVGDELVVTSPHHGDGLDGEVRTGDRAEVAGDRVHITGRTDTDEINVGGSKVSAGAVREVLLRHPEVAWASVEGRRAPVVGSVVSAQVVPRAPESARDLRDDLGRWCRQHLPEHGVPRRIRLLEKIPAKETLKSDV